MIGPRGYALIKRFESCKLRAYRCPAGIWTIGWGTTRIEGWPVRPGLTISQDEADLLLQIDAETHWTAAASAIHDVARLQQCKIDALASFVYNVGVGAFRHSSLLRYLNQGDAARAADEFLKWNKGTVKGRKVVLRGLTRRREAERALFMEALQA